MNTLEQINSIKSNPVYPFKSRDYVIRIIDVAEKHLKKGLPVEEISSNSIIMIDREYEKYLQESRKFFK